MDDVAPFKLGATSPDRNSVWTEDVNTRLITFPHGRPGNMKEVKYQQRLLTIGPHVYMYNSVDGKEVDVNVVSHINQIGRDNFEAIYEWFTMVSDHMYWFLACIDGMYQTLKITYAGAPLSKLKTWWMSMFCTSDGKYSRYRQCAHALASIIRNEAFYRLRALVVNVSAWFLMLGTAPNVWERYRVGAVQRFSRMVSGIQEGCFDVDLLQRLRDILRDVHSSCTPL